MARSTLDSAAAGSTLLPRAGLVLERAVGDGRFEAAEGPVRGYLRTVAMEPAGPSMFTVTETVEYRLAVPYWGWLVALPVRRALRGGGRHGPAGAGRDHQPWWAPPARLDARSASVLSTVVALTVVVGYLNTVFSQTVAFAGEEFAAGDRAQGLAGGAVRVGGLLALALLVAADRVGRRRVLVGASAAGCVLVATGAAAPSLTWLAGTQVVARGFATALVLLVAIVAAEEVPAGARAYAVSLLAMAGGLGAGLCVIGLRLADLGPRGWRALYLLPLLALPLVADVARRLPETRRFATPHARAPLKGHGRRLWLLAATGFLLNLFVAPDSQFANRFLRHERGFSGARISLLSIGTGTPAGLGVVVGGRLADLRGRRLVGAVALSVGTVLSVAFFFAHGWPLWAWALFGTVVSDAAIPALGVYGPELFPTSLRGRANGVVTVAALAGSAIGLLAAGALADHFGRLGPAMAITALGPLAVAVLLLVAYPETAGRELEDINPEDAEAAGP